MELPTDKLRPSTLEQRQLRNLLSLVASYCCRQSETTVKKYTHVPIQILNNGEKIRAINVGCFLPRSRLLLARLHALMAETQTLPYCIDLGDLNMEMTTLAKTLKRLTSLTSTATPIAHEDLLTLFVGCCKLQMDTDVHELLIQIRNDPGLLDITSLSVADFSFVLEMASNNRHQAKIGLNKLQTNHGNGVATTNSLNAKPKALGAKPNRRLSVIMQRKIKRRLETQEQSKQSLKDNDASAIHIVKASPTRQEEMPLAKVHSISGHGELSNDGEEEEGEEEDMDVEHMTEAELLAVIQAAEAEGRM